MQDSWHTLLNMKKMRMIIIMFKHYMFLLEMYNYFSMILMMCYMLLLKINELSLIVVQHYKKDTLHLILNIVDYLMILLYISTVLLFNKR